MVLGKHAVALSAHLAHALGIGGGQVKVGRLPPGQEGQFRPLALLGIGSLEQFVQGQAAQLLQKSQLAVQCSLQYRIQGPGGGLPHTDGLGFQHGGAQVVAPVGGALEQCGLKLRRGVTHRAHAVDAGFHAVGQIHQSGDHRIFQQGAEDDKPVQTGVPFSQFHILFPL